MGGKRKKSGKDWMKATFYVEKFEICSFLLDLPQAYEV
jgi:hypothetical protein